MLDNEANIVLSHVFFSPCNCRNVTRRVLIPQRGHPWPSRRRTRHVWSVGTRRWATTSTLSPASPAKHFSAGMHTRWEICLQQHFWSYSINDSILCNKNKTCEIFYTLSCDYLRSWLFLWEEIGQIV